MGGLIHKFYKEGILIYNTNMENFKQEVGDEENVHDDIQPISPQQEIQTLKDRLDGIERWSEVDGHPDDRRIMAIIKEKIKELENKISLDKKRETVKGTGIDIDAVDLSAARNEIEQDAQLLSLYNRSKRVILEAMPEPGPLRRRDVIAQTLSDLRRQKDPDSARSFDLLIEILKKHRK